MVTSDPSEEPVSRREFESRLAEVRMPPVVDPTANVLQLVEAAMKRQDDLRDAESRHRDALALLRSEMGRELREAESRRIDALSQAESRRIDALLAADRADRALATTRAELTAAALAERVDTSAKTLAASVEATAKANEAAVAATAKALAERIIPLEQARYEQAGSKSQQSEGRAQNQWVVGLVLSLPSAAIALVALVVLLSQPGV